mmetsp:Transcript_29736/g.85551  ORF Transcript_29736/g.85551 Transcript_29736/m.85551 type:complete len:256 (+) Transcript_29736:598-1365(+)
MVSIWSAMVCWNSKFSAFRFSLARCKSTCNCTICSLASAMASSKVLMSCSKDSIFASKSLFRSVALAIATSVSWNSALHQSLFLTSCACCSFNMATISSIAFFTFVKASSSTLVAKMDNMGLFVFCAVLRSNSAARRRSCEAPRTAATWTKLLKVLDIASFASSPDKISIASETALISAMRAALRSSKSLLASEHVFFMLAKKRWSSASTPFSCARSSLAWAWELAAFASWSFLSSSIFWPFSISAVFAAFSSAN